MAYAERNGVKLHWSAAGDSQKPSIVLLNSIGTDMSLWDLAVPELLGDLHVIRMDARGHGQSDAPAQDYTLADLADDVIAVMDGAKVDKAIVAGVSLGGMTAMELALRHPSRVNALILICTSAAMDRAAWSDRVTKVRAEGMTAIADLAIGRFFSKEFSAAHPDVVSRVRASLIAMSAAGYAGAGAAIRDMNLLDRLSALQLPTLLVVGENDLSTPYIGHGEVLESSLRAPTLVTLPCGHLAPLEVPHELVDAIINFLK